jgi:hypothetical protein
MNPVATLSAPAGIVLLICAGIGAIALISAAIRAPSPAKPQTTTPAKTDAPIIAPPITKAPRLLFILGLSALWKNPFQEGSWEKFSTTSETHECGKIECGLVKDGTEPHQVMISATVRETGSLQPIYRADTDELCNDQRVPSGSFYWYPGSRRQWLRKTTGGCNPVVTEYPTGELPALPADGKDFTVDFTIRAWSASGNEADPLHMSPRIAQHVCGDMGDVTTPVSPPCKDGDS